MHPKAICLIIICIKWLNQENFWTRAQKESWSGWSGLVTNGSFLSILLVVAEMFIPDWWILRLIYVLYFISFTSYKTRNCNQLLLSKNLKSLWTVAVLVLALGCLECGAILPAEMPNAENRIKQRFKFEKVIAVKMNFSCGLVTQRTSKKFTRLASEKLPNGRTLRPNFYQWFKFADVW